MRATTDSWTTAITEVHRDDINVRGEWVTDLMERASFAEVAFLILVGDLPTPGQARVLDALFVSIVDHGISPSSTVTRELASYGVPIQVGIAAGQLTVGDHHGGAGEQLAYQLRALVTGCREDHFAEDIRAAAKELVANARATRTPVHGFGHPQHDGDPRVRILRKIATEQGVASRHCEAVMVIEEELELSIGRRIPANIDAISAALLLDLGMDPRAARPLLMAPRVIGLAAHFMEEVDQGNVWRHVPSHQVTYTGKPARPLADG